MNDEINLNFIKNSDRKDIVEFEKIKSIVNKNKKRNSTFVEKRNNFDLSKEEINENNIKSSDRINSRSKKKIKNDSIININNNSENKPIDSEIQFVDKDSNIKMGYNNYVEKEKILFEFKNNFNRYSVNSNISRKDLMNKNKNISDEKIKIKKSDSH